MRRGVAACRLCAAVLVTLAMSLTYVPHALSTTAGSSTSQGDPADQWVSDLAALRPPHSAQPLSTFPGVVRLPRREWALFAGPSLSQASVSTSQYTSRLTYRVLLGESTGSNSVQVQGVAGRSLDVDAPVPGDCLQPAPNYCATTPMIQSRSPMIESFHQLRSAAGRPGMARHTACCNGDHWELNWYVPEDDTTHTLTLYLDSAERLSRPPVRRPTEENPRALWPENVALAQSLIDLTDNFIGLRGGRVVDTPTTPSTDPTATRVATSTVYRANQDRATLIGQDAASYNIHAWVDRLNAGPWAGRLSLDIQDMRERRQYRVARLDSLELMSLVTAADGSIQVRACSEIVN